MGEEIVSQKHNVFIAVVLVPSVNLIDKFVGMCPLKIYLSGSQAVADSEAVDCDLDLALIDHVDDCFSCSVHGDYRHGQRSIRFSIWFLVVVAFHLHNLV